MRAILSLVLLIALGLASCSPADPIGVKAPEATIAAAVAETAAAMGSGAVDDYGMPAATTAAPAVTNTSPPADAAQATPAPSATADPNAAAQAAPTATQPAAQAVASATAAVPVTGPVNVLADELLDFRVADPSGVPLGDVEDLLIDLSAAGAGSAPYLLMSSELNDDWLIPVPWQYVQVRPDLQAVIVPVNFNQLVNAPGFNEDFYPADIGQAFQASVNGFWQNPAAVTVPPTVAPGGLLPTAPTGYITASDLFGTDLIDQRGIEVAEVQDLVIDWANSSPANGATAAQFQWALLERSDTLGLGGENIPFPWRLLRVAPAQQAILTNVAAQVLQAAPSFNDLNRPDLYSAPWSTDLLRYWDAVQ